MNNYLYFWFFDTALLTNQPPIIYMRLPNTALVSYRYHNGKATNDRAPGMYTDQAFAKLHTDYASNDKGGWRSVPKCAWKKLFRERFGFSPEIPDHA